MGGPGDLMSRLEGEADQCHGWSNGPGDRYAAHSHAYRKILYCVSGSITFRMEGERREVRLGPGDRIVIEPGAVHSAIVGEAGVRCVEGRGRGGGGDAPGPG